MKKTYKDELAEAIHEVAAGICDAGLMPKSTMREIDELCLMSGQIDAIREESHVSAQSFLRCQKEAVQQMGDD